MAEICKVCNGKGVVRCEGMLCTDGKRRAILYKCKCRQPQTPEQAEITRLTAERDAAIALCRAWREVADLTEAAIETSHSDKCAHC